MIQANRTKPRIEGVVLPADSGQWKRRRLFASAKEEEILPRICQLAPDRRTGAVLIETVFPSSTTLRSAHSARPNSAVSLHFNTCQVWV